MLRRAALITISVAMIVGMSSARRAQALSAAKSGTDPSELVRVGVYRTDATYPQANWN
ncbi:MAG: hypothetical protein M3N95_02070 [Actinomycetota bacterium]|nr:hypothetical protein [Actinomycetota bacterium]